MYTTGLLWPHFWVSVFTVLLTFSSAALAIFIHYEGLYRLNSWLLGINRKHLRGMLLSTMLLILALHISEICLYGLVYRATLLWPEIGSLQNASPHNTHSAPHFLDAFYFSAIVYTSLGFGDVVPVGAVRMLSAVEGLLGLMLIAWSASFSFMQMERYWPAPDLETGEEMRHNPDKW